MVRGRVAHRLLGRHVRRRAEGEPRGGEAARHACLGERLGHTEVGDHRVPPLEQDVLRLHVTVHDPVLVGVAERVEELARDPHRVGEWQRALAQQSRAQRLPRHIGHHVPEQRVVTAGGEHRYDVRVLQPRDHLHLTAEPLSARRDRALQVEHLHHDPPPQGALLGEEHSCHTTAAELALDHERVAE